MVTEVLFVQGGGAEVHDQWDNKLVASLERALGDGYRMRYPRMPNEDDPSYAAWKPPLVEELKSLRDGAILVGHSIGGTILLHVLTETRLCFEPGALILIAAPFIGAGGWPGDEMATGTDLAGRLPAKLPVYLYHGAEDADVPTVHVHLYARAIPQAIVRVVPQRDHQLNNDLDVVAEDIANSRRARD